MAQTFGLQRVDELAALTDWLGSAPVASDLSPQIEIWRRLLRDHYYGLERV